VYQRANQFDDSRGSVKGWLLQYAYHRSINRKARLGRHFGYRAKPLDVVPAAFIRVSPPAIALERKWFLEKAIGQLPEPQRTTLALTCFEEMTIREVSERLRMSFGCARHHYYRGIARLQEWAGA